MYVLTAFCGMSVSVYPPVIHRLSSADFKALLPMVGIRCEATDDMTKWQTYTLCEKGLKIY